MTAFGLVQLKIEEGAWEANFRSALRSINRLADRGANCVILPEMWTGSERKKRGELAAFSREKLALFQVWAKEKRCAVVATHLEEAAGAFYNTAFYISEKGVVSGQYRKVHLFKLAGEERYFSAGEAYPPVIKTPWGKVAMAICFDLRFPIFFRRLVREGVTCFIVSAQWPAARKAHWRALLTARAIENQCVMIGVNRRGVRDPERFDGDSLIVGPRGHELLSLNRSQSIGIEEVAMNEVEKVRRSFPSLSLDHPVLDR